MDVNETIKVLAVLKAAYPHSFKDLSKSDAEAMIELWSAMFSGERYEEVNAAVAALISTRTVGFSPTIGEVKEKLHSLKTANELTEQDAWDLVAKACSNGLYGYKKEFKKLPPEVQRVIRSPEQIREWAKVSEEALHTTVANNFMRMFRIQRAREKEISMLPSGVSQMFGISGPKNAGLIGDGENDTTL